MSLAASDLNLGVAPTADRLGLSGDERNERNERNERKESADRKASAAKAKRKHARDTEGDSSWSSNATKHQQQASLISFVSGVQKKSPIESGTPARRLSKDQNEEKTISCRRRSRQSGNANSHRSSDRSDHPTDGVTFTYATALDMRLPQPADDNTISVGLRNLFYFVARHVSTYYMNDFSDFVPRRALARLKFMNSPLPPQAVDEVLEDTQSAQAIIQHCLNHLLLSSISTSSESPQANSSHACGSPKYPLLPAAFTAILHASARSSTAPRDEKYYLQALSKLRVLSSFLVPDIASSKEYQKQKRDMIDSAIKCFSRAFSPWESPKQSSSARMNNLKVIFEKTANVGILLFSQPSVFDFDWTPDSVPKKTDEITLSPSMFKVADENGTTLSLPQKMIDKKLSTLQPQKIEELLGLPLSASPAAEEVNDSGTPKPG